MLMPILNPIMRAILGTRVGGAFNPASMFTPTTPGWVYDLSDFSTLFQDSAGTIPVTAVEQPVGLVLDKSKGLVLGPELVTNGDFSGGTTGWAPSNATFTVVDGQANVVATTNTFNMQISQAESVVVGRTYEIKISLMADAANVTPKSAAFRLSDAAAGGNTLIAPMEVPANGVTHSISVLWVATVPTAYIQCRVASASSWGSTGDKAYFDNISVKLLPGNHASQPTSTKRPLLKVDGNGKHYLQGDGVDDFLSTAAIDFTNTDVVSFWGGVQKLSDATAGVIFELGTDSATVNGTFGLLAPHTSASSTFAFNSRGSAYAQAIATGYASPYKGVISAVADISTPTLSIAVNSDSAFTSATSQGTGNYSSNPVYFLSRAGTSAFSGAQVYSSVCLGRQATADELTKTRAWVAEKTGVTL